MWWFIDSLVYKQAPNVAFNQFLAAAILKCFRKLCMNILKITSWTTILCVCLHLFFLWRVQWTPKMCLSTLLLTGNVCLADTYYTASCIYCFHGIGTSPSLPTFPSTSDTITSAAQFVGFNPFQVQNWLFSYCRGNKHSCKSLFTPLLSTRCNVLHPTIS